jgi:hypothetical protein
MVLKPDNLESYITSFTTQPIAVVYGTLVPLDALERLTETRIHNIEI